ncbi:MAG: outer membrane protein [Rhodoferax sp.]
MKNTVVVACLALAAPLAFAQAKNFEGFTLGANIASTKTTIETNAGNADGNTTGVDIQLQYNFALSPQFVMGIGMSMGTAENKAGTLSNVEYGLKERSAIEFTPGFVVSDSLLVFGKIASLNATGVQSTGGTATQTGIGYGLGVRGMVDKHMYWQVGYDVNTYGEKSFTNGTPYKFKSSAFSAGVGYKF